VRASDRLPDPRGQDDAESYIIFLFDLATSIYIMSLLTRARLMRENKFNGQEAKALVLITVVIGVAQALF